MKIKYLHYSLLSSLFLILVIGLSFLFKVPGLAMSSCSDVVLIYARGSGQSSDTSQIERDVLSQQLQRLLPGKSVITKDLQSGMFEGSRGEYPAVPVGLDGLQKFKNSLSGEWEWTAKLIGGKYPESITAGSELLVEYFQHLETSGYFVRCPQSRIVVSGFSQGAQVIGRALREETMNKFLNNIAFVALFGDPTYKSRNYLEIFEPQYKWYRGDVASHTFQSSIYEPSEPYVPKALEGRTGSWCKKNDPLCNGNLTDIFVGGITYHQSYINEAIPQAAAEIALQLREDWKAQGASVLSPPACGAAKQDIVLLLDTSATMANDFYFWDETPGRTGGDVTSSRLWYTANTLIDSSCDSKVAIVPFGHEGSNVPPNPVLDFTNDKAKITATIKSLRNPDRSRILKQTSVRPALLGAMKMTWRPDAQKAVVIITDSVGEGFDPTVRNDWQKFAEFMNEPLSKQIIAESRAKGGVEVYPFIMPHVAPTIAGGYLEGWAGKYYQFLSSAFGGETLPPECTGNCAWGNSNLGYLKSALAKGPVVTIPAVRAKTGERVTFKPASIKANIHMVQVPATDFQIRWDFNCDGIWDSSSSNLDYNMNYTYTNPHQCKGAALVERFSHATNWPSYSFYDRSLVLFDVDVRAPGTEKPWPGPIQNLTKLWNKDRKELLLDWEPPSNSNETGDLVYVVRDDNGSILGVLNETKLTITNMPTTEPIITVATHNEFGVSPSVSLTTAKDVTPSVIEEKRINKTVAGIRVSGVLGGVRPLQYRDVAKIMGRDDFVNNFSEPLQLSATSSAHKALAETRAAPTSTGSMNLSIIAIPIAVAVSLIAVILNKFIASSRRRY